MDNAERSSSAIWWVVGLIVVMGLGYLVFRQTPSPEPRTQGSAQTTTQPAPTSTGTNVVPELGGPGIGVVLPLTGSQASLGMALKKSILLAVQRVNQLGGANGEIIHVDVQDGKCDNKGAVDALNAVSTTLALIGGGCPEEALALAPAATEKRIPFVALSTSAELTGKGSTYMFRLAPSDALIGRAAAVYLLKELNVKRAAVISENAVTSQAIRKAFTTTFDGSGGGVVSDEVSVMGAFDADVLAEKVKASRADAVLITDEAPATVIAIVKALRTQRSNLKILTTPPLFAGDAAKNQAEALEGVIGLEPAFDQSTPAASGFVAAYTSAYSEDLTHPVAQANAYSAVFLLKDAMTRAGEITREDIQTELAKTGNWSGGALTNVSFDKNRDLDWKTFAVKQITGGKVTAVKTMTLE